jgi:hypothetical protein
LKDQPTSASCVAGHRLADHTDWVTFWSLTAFLAVSGLLLLLWIMRLYPPGAVIQRSPASSTTFQLT